MANGIRTGDPVDSIKDVVRSSVKVPKFDKYLKKARGHIDRCGNKNKDEDNSPKTLNDKNQQASSQKFRQQTPEEGRRIYRPKRWGNNNKDEDNSPKTLNDKYHQASSQKFRQQTPEEGPRTYRPKRCRNNNKDEDNDKYHQKFRQLILMIQFSINHCISHRTNTLGKGMNPIILPPAMGK